ncbi:MULTISPECIES: hypothetical protein [Pseudomonas]|uniref:Uncharacterized protein n=1 Tax=Pseudomonas putida TaxID=303 RepID=A0A8I1EFQ0_PSEPU|nr:MULTISPECIES: hypothetical protein [Pseudomonas]AVD92114.1 hypothetical protein C4Q27_06600 [Pseudomonas sp. SWI36]MBI6884806.1 hypothetical protein [Pseudomonas putida]OAS06638.1 hypothetical protein AYO08_11780 [Pseudomonas putida]
MLQILDVWGEGRIVQRMNGEDLITGFNDAYNLNKAGQLISNGPFAGGHIPNLIVVYEYDAPDFPLDDHAVPHVTLMGAPITHRVAEEMCRVVARPGKIYLYDPNETDRRMFEAVAIDHGMQLLGRFHPAELDPPFNEITLLAAYVYRAPTSPLPRPKTEH